MGTSIREYKGISSRSQSLLKQQEGFDVEFKQSISGLDSEDIVAFANSTKGGSILIGIQEEIGVDGRQLPNIIGCNVGDKAKRSIIGKASSCLPPIGIEIVIENLNGNPFLRVEISSGKDKPYCTRGGTYKIRDDGGNHSIPPTMLLSMFLEKESMQFWERFQTVTITIQESLSDLQERLEGSLNSIERETIDTKDSLQETLGDIGGFAEIAQYESENASSQVDVINRNVENLWTDLSEYGNEISAKMDMLLKHYDIPDPAVLLKNDHLVLAMWHDINDGIPKEETQVKFFKLYSAGTVEQFNTIYEQALDYVNQVEDYAKNLNPPKKK